MKKRKNKKTEKNGDKKIYQQDMLPLQQKRAYESGLQREEMAIIKKSVGKEEDDLVLCLLMLENKKENVQKKVKFFEDVKQPSKVGMLCTIDGDTFLSFTKNTWIVDSGALCHIMKDDTSLFDIIDINESI